VDSVIEIAESKGLDFFVLTGHNNNRTWTDHGHVSSKLTLLYGFEWTTDMSHANVISDNPFNWSRIMATDGGSASAAKNAIKMARILETGTYQTILFSISHPAAPTCSWQYSFEDSMGADSMKVWNAGYTWPNMNFLSLIDSYLKQGKKISMVGGSDRSSQLTMCKRSTTASECPRRGYMPTQAAAPTYLKG